MINSNLNTIVPINLTNFRKASNQYNFSTEEKAEMIASLQFFGPNLKNFVFSFYKAFISKKISKFDRKESESSLINMLSASTNLIITCLESPNLLIEYIEILLAHHPSFSKIIQYTDLFVNSFMIAIIDSFKENFNERLGALWFKAVSSFAFSVNLLLKSSC